MGRIVADKTLLLAIMALFTSLFAVFFAYQSNQIALKSYELAYQANLPIITATYSCDAPFDIPEMRTTEVIEVENQGEPLTNYVGRFYEWLWVWCPSCNRTIECIPLQGYWDIPEYTGDCQGLLQKFVSRESAYSLYQSISYDFKQAAARDGYEATILERNMLYVEYTDFGGKRRGKWINPTTWGGNTEYPSYASSLTTYLEETIHEEPWNFFWLDKLQGATLWDWYRDKALQ